MTQAAEKQRGHLLTGAPLGSMYIYIYILPIELPIVLPIELPIVLPIGLPTVSQSFVTKLSFVTKSKLSYKV